jgi:hypothetical protein
MYLKKSMATTIKIWREYDSKSVFTPKTVPIGFIKNQKKKNSWFLVQNLIFEICGKNIEN